MIYNLVLQEGAADAATFDKAVNKLEPYFQQSWKKALGNPFKDADAKASNVTLLKKVINKYIQTNPGFENYLKLVTTLALQELNIPVEGGSYSHYYMQDAGIECDSLGLMSVSPKEDLVWLALRAESVLIPKGYLQIADLAKAWPMIAAAVSLYMTANRYSRWHMNDVVQLGILLRESSGTIRYDNGVPFIRISNIHTDNDRDIERDTAVLMGYSRDISRSELSSVMKDKFGKANPQSTFAVGPWQLHWGSFSSSISKLGIPDKEFTQKDWILSAAWPWWVQYMVKDSMVNATINWKKLKDPSFKLLSPDSGKAYGSAPVKRAYYSYAFSGQPAIYGSKSLSAGHHLYGKDSFKSWDGDEYGEEVDARTPQLEEIYNIAPYTKFSEVIFFGPSKGTLFLPADDLNISEANALSAYLTRWTKMSVTDSLENSALPSWATPTVDATSSTLSWLMSTLYQGLRGASALAMKRKKEAASKEDDESTSMRSSEQAKSVKTLSQVLTRSGENVSTVPGPSTSPYINFEF